MDLRYGVSWGHSGTPSQKPSRWILECALDNITILQLVVDRSWNGSSWNSYSSFLVDDVGDTRELVTYDEFLRQYGSYLDNIGEEPPSTWSDRWSTSAAALARRDEMIRRWEAIVDQLGLLNPATTL